MIDLKVKTTEVEMIYLSAIKYIYKEVKNVKKITIEDVSKVFDEISELKEMVDNEEEYSMLKISNSTGKLLFNCIKTNFIAELKEDDVNDYDWFIEMLSIYKQLKKYFNKGEEQVIKPAKSEKKNEIKETTINKEEIPNISSIEMQYEIEESIDEEFQEL